MNGDRCVLCETKAETGAPGRRILLVEDEALIALNEAMVLRRDGYEVLTVHTGEKAVATVETDPSIDLILMDIDLGRGIDGTQAAERILRHRRVPIVFLTSHSEAEMVARVKGITRYGYVLKNSGEFVLRQAIAGAFELYEAHQAHKLLFDHALSGLCIFETICDQAGQLVDARHLEVNRAFMLHTGLRREQVVGRTLREVYGDTGGVRGLLDAYTQALEKPTHSPVEHHFETTGRWLALNAYYSGAERFSVVLRDITEERRGRRMPLSTRSEEVSFLKLFSLERIQALQDGFSRATGVASVITYPDGRPITRPSNFCRLCRDIIRKTPRGRENCERSDAVIGSGASGRPTVTTCLSGGLWDAGASITVEGTPIAKWLVGQVRNESISEERMRAYATEIGADPEETVRAYREVPGMSRDRFEAIAAVLHTLVQELSETAYLNLQQAQLLVEKEAKEEQIEALLAQKELVMRELHHRIKNDMTLVRSLLSMQARHTTTPEARDSLHDAGRRVGVFSKTYERLYKGSELDEVEACDVIGDLLKEMQAGSFPFAVDLTVRIEDLKIPTRLALSISVVLNELVTNALKYAFEGTEHPRMEIRLERVGRNEVSLLVADNGPGFPREQLTEASYGYGLTVVDALVEQHQGSLYLDNLGGARAQARFSLE